MKLHKILFVISGLLCICACGGDDDENTANANTDGNSSSKTNGICNYELVAGVSTAVYRDYVEGASFMISVALTECRSPSQFQIEAARVDGTLLTLVQNQLCNCADGYKSCETTQCSEGSHLRLFFAEIPPAGSKMLELDVVADGVRKTLTVEPQPCASDPVCFGAYCDKLEGNCQVCTPSCGSRVCGADGCGGECGYCNTGYVCIAGACVEETVNQCPAGCQVGAVCCGGIYCAGDCIGSPCC